MRRKSKTDDIVNSILRSVSSDYGRKCIHCGQSLEGGAYTAAWENGNNPDGYIRCPHCRKVNFDD